jgi:uncharacterized protein (DUF736 family)
MSQEGQAASLTCETTLAQAGQPALKISIVLFLSAISFSTLNVNARITPVEKTNDKAPDFRIYAGRGEIEFGAAWRKTSNEGRDYLSVKLDDPSFPSPIYASLVEVEGEDGLSLIWSRRNGD